MRYIAKRAATGANGTQNHEGGRAVTKAFVNVRATGVFANGNQTVFAQSRFQVGYCIARGNTNTDPAWLTQDRCDFKFHRTAGNFIFAQLLDAFLQRSNRIDDV